MMYVSLFSGIEAASVAWKPLGWDCAAVAEVEAFPSAVLAHHYPNVPNLGDVTKITKERIEQLGHVDLLVGGFPCQDLSVAGKRAGLRNDDGSATRSGLFFTGMQIAEWSGARYVLVENVPGLFSSNKGRDFAAVVGEMAGSEFDVPGDGWGNAGFAVGPKGLVEWATLDAQFVRVESHPRAVPQRRRRVFIVRDSGNWTDRPPIFLVRESLLGHPPPRRQAGQRIAACTAPSLTASGRGVERTGESRGQDPVVAVPATVGALTDGAHMGGGLNGQDAYSGRIFAVARDGGLPTGAGCEGRGQRHEAGTSDSGTNRGRLRCCSLT